MAKLMALTGLLSLMAGSLAAAETETGEPYNLLFRSGTLDRLDQETALVYNRHVTNMAKPDAAARDTGDVSLSIMREDATLVQLDFLQEGKHRALGRFPVNVGNPMIMYFYETVIRDMAETAGGSPYYIRNRVKDALTQPVEPEEGEAVIDGESVSTITVSLRPFEHDPNRDRMRGFGDLEMRITMSEEVPGWYLSLVAETTPEHGTPPFYRSAVMFEGRKAVE